MNDAFVLTFSDMKRLFLRHKKKMKSVAVFCALFVFSILLVQAPQYQIESTFKQSNKQSDITSSMKKVVQQFMPLSSETALIAVMQSNDVMGRAVERLGLQAACKPGFVLGKILKRIRNNVVVECGGTLSDPDVFSFANVLYSGEKPLKLFIRAKSDRSFELLDTGKHVIVEGKLGESLVFPSGRLTLVAFPSDIKIDSLYPLSIHPLLNILKRVRSQLRISPHKLDKNIIHLQFFWSNRHEGAAFLNHLMLSYQEYLKKENDDICQMQLEYLNRRQQELTRYYDEALEDHSSYLKENLEKNGFIGFTEEIATLSEPKNLYTSKLFDVDLELKRLIDARMSFARGDQLLFPSGEELLEVETELREARDLLASVKEEKTIPETPSLLKEPRSAIAMLVKQIEQKEVTQGNRLLFAAYLQEIIGQLEQKQKTLKENLELQRQGCDEFLGLNLATAQGLLVEYTRQRDSYQAQMKELIFLREQLNKPGFEVSSLGGVSDD